MIFVCSLEQICTVGKAGMGLNYRGYAISDLAEHCIFEEVAYLLIYGSLPTQRQLDACMDFKLLYIYFKLCIVATAIEHLLSRRCSH